VAWAVSRAWRRDRQRGNRGFTLIELLVVLSIIVILASLGMAGYSHSITRAREATLKEDLFRLRDAVDQYYADRGQYPQSLESLVTDGYLRAIPGPPYRRTPGSGPSEPDRTTRRPSRVFTTSERIRPHRHRRFKYRLVIGPQGPDRGPIN
jgi:general secretion pathway protein G